MPQTSACASSRRLRPDPRQPRAGRRRGRAGGPAEPRDAAASSALERISADYDFILIDCPPSLNLLTVNALAAARAVLIPMQCEYYALEGLSDLVGTIKRVRAHLNPRLEIDGLLRTMFDPRNTLAQQVSQQLEQHFGDKVYRTIVPRNVRLAEAPSYGAPAVIWDKASQGRAGLSSRSPTKFSQRADRMNKTQGTRPRTGRAARRRRGQRAQGRAWRRCRWARSGPASTSRARAWTSSRCRSLPPRSRRRA